MDTSNLTMNMANGTDNTTNLTMNMGNGIDNTTQSMTNMGNGIDNTTNLTTSMDLADVVHNETSLMSYLSDMEGCLDMYGSWMQYALPAVIVMGLVGNCTTGITIICRRLNTENAIFGFFLFISINDLIVNVMAAKEYVLSLYPDLKLPSQLSCAADWYPSVASTTASAWILVAANLYKLYVLAFPLKAFHMNGVKIATVTSVVIMGVMYAYAAHVFWFIGPQIVMNEDTNANTTVYLCYYDLVNNDWIHILDMIAYSIVPGAILIVTSVSMFVIFMRQYRKHKALKQGEGHAKVKASVTFRNTKNTVSILLPASFLHILCTLPINLVWIVAEEVVTKQPYIYCISLLLLFSNHSLNVYTQSLSSKKFRDSLLGR